MQKKRLYDSLLIQYFMWGKAVGVDHSIICLKQLNFLNRLLRYTGIRYHIKSMSQQYIAINFLLLEASVKSEKIQKIMKIWRDGQGVLLLELFHHIIPAEAHTKEAAIIDAIGKLSIE